MKPSSILGIHFFIAGFGIPGMNFACDAIDKEKESSEDKTVIPEDHSTKPGDQEAEGSLDCTDQECDNGGFRLYILPTKGTYPPGGYQIDIKVEEFEFSSHCQVVQVGKSPPCTSQADEGIFNFDIDYDDVETGKEHTWRGFDIEIHENTDPKSSIRGPETISVTITNEHSWMASETFTPEYDRTTPWGSLEECGFCDVMEAPLIMKVTLAEESL